MTRKTKRTPMSTVRVIGYNIEMNANRRIRGATYTLRLDRCGHTIYREVGVESWWKDAKGERRVISLQLADPPRRVLCRICEYDRRYGGAS